MRQRFSQNGFSLIEVVISMAILGILVTAVLSSTVGSDSAIFNKSVLSSASCRSEAQNILNNFKSKGMIRRYNMQLTTAPAPAVPPTTEQRPSPSDVAANELGLNFAQRWNPAPYEITTETASPVIRPYRLLMGAITTIETIYNYRNTDVCTTGANLGLPSTSAGTPLNLLLRHPVGVEDVLPGQTSSGLKNPTAHLRIRAYESAGAGAVIPCAPNLYTRPPRGGTRTLLELATGSDLVEPAGMNDANVTNTNNYPIAPTVLKVAVPDTSSRDNIAWEVTISITHENKNGQLQTCSASERFQYPSMRFDEDKPLHVRGQNTNIPIPDVTSFQPLNASVVSSAAGYNYLSSPPVPPANPAEAPYRNCGVTPEATVDIFVRNARPNTIFMCRNLSFQRPLQSGSTVGTPVKMLINNFPDGATAPADNGGIRQSFITDEIMKHTYFSLDNSDTNVGDLLMLGLFYPNGTYYCHSDDGCTAIPSFLNMDNSRGAFAPNGANWDGYFTPNNNGANTDSGFWVPCERAFIQCAPNASAPYDPLISHPPSIATFEDGATGTELDRYHLRYDNLPPGCEVHLQIAEVDAAYNVRAVEVREFIQEPLPGNKLCWTGAGVPGRNPNSWYFSCDPTPDGGVGATNQIAGTDYPACTIVNPRNTAVAPFTRATYNTYPGSPPCCINFPGDPDMPTSDMENGIWRHPNPPVTLDP